MLIIAPGRKREMAGMMRKGMVRYRGSMADRMHSDVVHSQVN